MSLIARIEVATRGVAAELDVDDGATLALLGANGSGKTTILECLAGLVDASAGAASFRGRTLVDAGTRTTPLRERRVSLVTQDAALFPSMSVLDNVAFGPRSRGMSRPDSRARAAAWLERLDVADLAARRPGSLSGGQARRVAIARALAAEPELLLLDEPFAGVDVAAAGALRALLPDAIDAVTTILTTHDALDAMALASSVAVLEHGRVVESGATRDVLARPRTAHAARMTGRTLVVGTIAVDGLTTAQGWAIDVGPHDLPLGTRAGVALHPREVLLSERGHPAVVHGIEARGDVALVHVGAFTAEVDVAVAAALRPGQGVRVATATAQAPYPV